MDRNPDEIVDEVIKLLGGSFPLHNIEWDSPLRIIMVNDCDNKQFIEIKNHFLDNKYYECKNEDCLVCKMYKRGMKFGDSSARDLRPISSFVFAVYDLDEKIYYPLKISKMVFNKILETMGKEIEICKCHSTGFPPVKYNVEIINQQTSIPQADFSFNQINTNYHKIDTNILDKLKHA